MNFSFLTANRTVWQRTPLLLAVCAVLLVSACQTVPKPEDVPADLSPAKFFQKVQESVDADQYDVANFYLEEFRKRFATSTDPGMLDKMMEADYLSAQITYKKGKLPEARAKYAALLAQYDGIPAEANSPPRWIKILCTKLIEIIDKKLGDKAPKAATPSPSAITSPNPSPAPTQAGSEPVATDSPVPAASATPNPSPTATPKATS